MNETTSRAGIKTTEFWIALIVATLSGLAALYTEEQWAQVAGIVSMALTSAFYGKSREAVKRVEVMTNAQRPIEVKA